MLRGFAGPIGSGRTAGMAVTRRVVLQGGAGAVAALVFGCRVPRKAATPDATAAAKPETGFEPNAWLRIGADGAVTVIVAESEMGQGVVTSLPMIVADELRADWKTVRWENALNDPQKYGRQLTGGSTSVRGSFETLTQAAAAAREVLVAAAAKTWNVPAAECRAENGAAVHAASGRRAGFGELVEAAAGLPVPEKPALLDAKERTLVGTSVARLDIPEKTDGRAVFGIDVQRPGMLVATVARCPVFGGKVASFDDTKARKVSGVKHVVDLGHGVGIVATDHWSALQARKKLSVTWDEGPFAKETSDTLAAKLEALGKKPGAVAKTSGDAAAAIGKAKRKVEAVYRVPYLAHATMEPLNATAHVHGGGCEVWAPTQGSAWTTEAVAKAAGVPPEKVVIHMTLLGGGFGRKAESDFVVEAAALSKAAGAPVKVIWTREDDTRHDFYRPATWNSLRGALDEDGWPIAWHHRIVGPSILERFGAPLPDGIDRTSVEGAANLPYAIGHFLAEYTKADLGVPVGFWRSVGSSQNAFVTECFLDELAAAGKKDPLEVRRRLLKENPRYAKVLELAAEKAGWGTPVAPSKDGYRRGRGLALAESFGSIVAQVAEVTVERRSVRVDRVVCAIDCGDVVNPDTIEAQMQGGIVYGLTAALHGEITIEKGRVRQGNFHEYALLRSTEMPKVEVHVVRSGEALGGVGEPGVPPIAPAVCNAVAAATGVRIRELPIDPMLLRRT